MNKKISFSIAQITEESEQDSEKENDSKSIN